MDEFKKTKLKELLQDPSIQAQMEKGQMFGPGYLERNNEGNIPWKKHAEDLGISGAPISQLPLLQKLFTKDQSKAPAIGGKFGASPAVGALNREGGPLDVSPAGVAGTLADVVLDPMPANAFPKGMKILNKALHRDVGAKSFSEAVENARNLRPDVVENVSQYSPEDYAKMRTFLSPDKKSGFALKPTEKGDELVNVFSAEKGLGRGDKLVSEAVDRGAQTLDAFDGYLPKLYEKHGFKEYKREPNFTPGNPDVVYMSQPKNPKLSVEDLNELSERQLPPELRRPKLSMEPLVSNPDQTSQIDALAKKVQYDRVMEMLQNRQKLRSKHIGEDTDIID